MANASGKAWAQAVEPKRKVPAVMLWLKSHKDGPAVRLFIDSALAEKRAKRAEFSLAQLHAEVESRWPSFKFALATLRNYALRYVDGKSASA